MSSYFRLIGIKVYKMDGAIQKVLHPGWYPFGKYEAPRRDGYLSIQKQNDSTQQIYKIHRNIPQVHVCCIAGKNGSGKSSIIELIYRILNNLAMNMQEVVKPPVSQDLAYAYGVRADLYYELDDEVYCLQCNEIDVEIYRCQNERLYKVDMFKGTDIEGLVKHFFYTIGFNYSLYAFNSSDFKSISRKNINGDWLHGIFHKNDGYMVPLTLVPFRENGIIQLEKENNLAKQRIIVLSLLGMGQNRPFPEGYKINEIRYSLNQEYYSTKLKYIRQQLFEFSEQQQNSIIDKIQSIWEELEGDRLEKSFQRGTDGYKIALFYLVYKTIKICLTYNDYYELMQIQRLKDISHKPSYSFKMFGYLVESNAESVINKLRQDVDPITLKINQCLTAMSLGKYGNKGKIDLQQFKSKDMSYDDVVKLLPPPFYNLDIAYVSNRRKNIDSYWKESENNGVIRLSKMSSGERQMLFCASYIIYHLKNLQTIKEDKFRYSYHNVNIIMDEVELYFHPEYQRLFISFLLDALQWSHIDGRKIRGINILIATHSPFVLSDILTEHTLYLKKGSVVDVKQQTFGGNYYEMLRSSFFFENSAIGEVSSRFMSQLIDKKKARKEISEEDIKKVGDPYIKAFLEK